MDKEALERRLAAIFEEAEEAGIHLDSKPERVPVSRGDRLAESFEEISRFVDECGREPVKGLSMNERRLAARLEQIRQDPVRAPSCAPLTGTGCCPSRLPRWRRCSMIRAWRLCWRMKTLRIFLT